MLPTFRALCDAFKAEVQSRRADLTDWNEGSVLDAIGGAGAMLADESMRVSLAAFSELFFDTAVGTALDRLALDRIGLVRKPATAAYGEVVWTRGTAGAYTIPAGAVFSATVNGQTFQVTSLHAVGLPAAKTSAKVAVVASSSGRATNLAAGTITTVVSSVSADTAATVTNLKPLAGGSDVELDAAFRDRIRRYYSTLRRGTVAALEVGALSVPGVAYVYVDESRVDESGWVYLYVGDPDARSNDVLAGLVSAEMINWRAAGVLVEVLGSSRDEVALSIAVDIERGADQVSLAAAIRASVVGYGDAVRPSRPARISRIERAVQDASALVLACEVTSHDADIEPTTAAQAVRFVGESITLTFTEVAP